MSYTILFRAIVLVLIGLLSACRPGQPASMSIATVPPEYAGKTAPANIDLTAGQQIYINYCQSCHGPFGYGDGPMAPALNPRPRNLVLLVPTLSDDYLFWRVSEGVEGTSMVGWAGVLTEQDIWNVVVYLRTFK